MTATPPRLPSRGSAASGARRAWIDQRPEIAPTPSQSGTVRTRWARVALRTCQGEAVAVRLQGPDLWVGIRHPHEGRVVWRPASSVLSPAQAARWVASGFGP